jgi:hypothetical protein
MLPKARFTNQHKLTESVVAELSSSIVDETALAL